MSSLDYHARRTCRILWAIEFASFVAILVIAAIAYTVTP